MKINIVLATETMTGREIRKRLKHWPYLVVYDDKIYSMDPDKKGDTIELLRTFNSVRSLFLDADTPGFSLPTPKQIKDHVTMYNALISKKHKAKMPVEYNT